MLHRFPRGSSKRPSQPGHRADRPRAPARAPTKALYHLMLDEVTRHGFSLQVIALDHAEFDDDCSRTPWRIGGATVKC